MWNDEGDDGDVPPHSIIKGRSTGIVHPAGVTFNAKDGEVIAPDAVWNGLFTFLKPELFKMPPAPVAMIRRLLGILGRRTMLTFGLVTFIVGALLATVNITSRYALKVYVDDQLKRHSVGPRRLPARARSMATVRCRAYVAKTPGVTQGRIAGVPARALSRGRRGRGASRRKPFTTPWLCVLAASDPAILPPELGFALAQRRRRRAAARCWRSSGPSTRWGRRSSRCRERKDFTLQVHVAEQPRFLFNTPLQSVVRLDRDDLNRWLMDQTGSVSYIPYIGAILLMPYDWDMLTKFDQVATGFVPEEVLGVGNEEAGHIQMAEYAPEVVYVAKIDRPQPDLRAGTFPARSPASSTINTTAAPRRHRDGAGAEEGLHGTARAHARRRRGRRRRQQVRAAPTSSSTARPKCCWSGCRTSPG